jgi:hypothetical protein
VNILKAQVSSEQFNAITEAIGIFSKSEHFNEKTSALENSPLSIRKLRKDSTRLVEPKLMESCSRLEIS